MDDTAESRSEAYYAGWMAARFGLLEPSIERFLALMAAAESGDEGWRAGVMAELALWRALRQAEEPPVPAAFAGVHARSAEVLALLVEAGDRFRAAIGADDADGVAAAFGLLDEADALARGVFVEAMRLAGERDAFG